MTKEALREELVRELDHLSAEQLKAVHQLINTFKEPTVQPAPDQDAIEEVREALSSLSEPLYRFRRRLRSVEKWIGCNRWASPVGHSRSSTC